MDLLAHSLQSDRYRGCAITTLCPSALLELGRVIAHHGLLVERVRDFVTYVASQSQGLPPTIGSRQSIELLPSAMEIVKPAFDAADRYILQNALDQVAMVEEVIDRFHYSTWGTLPDRDGDKFARSEYRQYQGLGCRLDQTIYSPNELHRLAMEISLAIKCIGKAQGIVERKLAEQSRELRKKFDRKRIRAVRCNGTVLPSPG